MSSQYNKVQKRRRRVSYIRRKKARLKATTAAKATKAAAPAPATPETPAPAA